MSSQDLVRTTVFLCFLFSIAPPIGARECIPDSNDPESCSTKSIPADEAADQAALLQGRVRVSLEHETTSQGGFKYGPVKFPRSMVHYFTTWAKGKLDNRINSDINKLETGKRARSLLSIEQTESRTGTQEANAAWSAYMAAAESQCPHDNSGEVHKAFHLLEWTQDGHGVKHLLLKGKGGHLQHLALRKDGAGPATVLHADPPICRKGGLLQVGGSPDLKAKEAIATGGSIPLQNDDQTVTDCTTLFKRTFKHNCGTELNLEVLSASVHMIDGIAVNMEVKVCHEGSTTDCHLLHHPECDFEKNAHHDADASLLQKSIGYFSHDRPFPDDVTDLEKDGLEATLRLSIPLCEAADKDDGQSLALRLAQTRAFGENSLYKGYEHVNDKLPRYSALQVEADAEEVDFRDSHPNCFPALSGEDKGSETVRNQGTCGSCWAFAAATTAMHNLCSSIDGTDNTHNSADDRMEVSVQKILSCEFSDGSAAQGCSGGNMAGFNQGATERGLTAEKDNLYKCGGGDPLEHFSEIVPDCNAFPWGGACTGSAQPQWYWGGAFVINGEDAMKSYIASGYSLYGSFVVYDNFMTHTQGIYTGPASGNVAGGHAVNLMGYGTESSTKYWLVQNSWGIHNYGEDGFGKFLRGTDLCGIEADAYGARAWVDGGAVPPCMDSNGGTGLSSDNTPIPCSDALSGNYGNLCENAQWGSSVRANCANTCGSCTGTNGGDGGQAPPSPTPGPTPAPPSAPACQGDSTSWNANYGKCDTYTSTNSNHGYCNSDSDGGFLAEEVCSECGVCTDTDAAPTEAPTQAPTAAPTKAPTEAPATMAPAPMAPATMAPTTTTMAPPTTTTTTTTTMAPATVPPATMAPATLAPAPYYPGEVELTPETLSAALHTVADNQTYLEDIIETLH